MNDDPTPKQRQTNSLSGGMIPDERAAELCETYRAALLDDVIPWWMEHSIDPTHGGYYSLLGRDGKPWANDKYMWMNSRQVWMLSHLYNTHEQKNEWLEAAMIGADFMREHAFKDDDKMHFRLTREGQSRSEVLSLYTEVFGAIALAEYAAASGAGWAAVKSLRMYDLLIPRLGRPSNTALLGYPIHGSFHLHAHDMCRITVAWVFHRLHPDQRYADDLTISVQSIVGRHWKPELGALLENVAMDGSPLLDLPEGRMFHPGHAIESAWMLMEIAAQRGDGGLVETAIQIVLAALEHGWDQTSGGLRYIVNIDRTPVHDLGADLRLWWTHCETLYGLLLAWDLTGREDMRRWYETVHQYTFSAFPDPAHGEWFGYLNPDGSTVWTAKANGWKGCFHLPRALYRAYQLLKKDPRPLF